MSLSYDLNVDFIKAYRTLDQTLRNNAYQGLGGYIAKMEAISFFEKRHCPDFARDLLALKETETLYRRLFSTADLSKAVATEDHVDFLKNFTLCLVRSHDPIALLQEGAFTGNNPDAIKAKPIESQAFEISARPTFFKEGAKKKALKTAALAALALAVILRIRKGWIR